MLLSAAAAAKFWPIYTEYEAELSKLNDQRVANIHEYALDYSQMTDAKADELIRTRCRIKNSVASFLQNTMTASNRNWGRLQQRALLNLNINCLRLSIFELPRNCRLLERAREYHEEQRRNAKGN